MFNPAKDIDQEALRIEGRFYKARVVDNNDPLQLGRIKPRVKELHRRIPDSDLPWALPILYLQSGSAPSVGGLRVPVKGAWVVIVFAGDDLYSPVYIGDTTVNETKITELLEDYPDTYGHIDKFGNLFAVNTKKGTWKWIHQSGAEFSFDGKGHLKIITSDSGAGEEATKKGLTLEVQGGVDIKATEIINIESQQDINIKALKNITIESQAILALKGLSQAILHGGSTIVDGTGVAISPTSSPPVTTPPPVTPTPPVARTTPPETDYSNKVDD